MKDNTIILIVGAAGLTLIALMDANQRAIVTGALIGLVAGHVNGSASADNASGP